MYIRKLKVTKIQFAWTAHRRAIPENKYGMTMRESFFTDTCTNNKKLTEIVWVVK